MTLVNPLQDARLHVQMALCRRRMWNPFMEQLRQPQAVQDKVLKKILQTQASTVFGDTHRFKLLRGYQEYRLEVPIHTYEDLRLPIEDQEELKEARLNREQPQAYAVTSGTTGHPKLIPVLNGTREALHRYQWLSTYAQYQAIPSIFKGKMLVIAGAEVEGYLQTGTSYGSMSGMLTAALPSVLQRKLFLPRVLHEVGDYQRKYFYLAAWALAEPNLSVVATANPSTFLKLLDMGRQHFPQLVEMLASQQTGSTEDYAPLPHLSRQRLSQLLSLVGHEDRVTVQELWPHLKAVVTWTGGSCGVLVPMLQARLAPQTAIVEMGYLSSECVGSVNVDPLTNRCVPLIQDYVYEFILQDDWEADRPHTMTLEQLEEGQKYYVVVTTPYGLYRYFMNDLVEVTGRFHKTPTIAFVQKGKGVTNITGEKLYEYHVMDAMEAIQQTYRIRVEFYVMLADSLARQYTLFMEHAPLDAFVGYQFEKALAKSNVEFQAKRDSERLEPIRVVYLEPGTGEAYRAHSIRQGQRDSQFKVMKLQYAKDCSFDFMKHERNAF
ncbi:MAG: GH3 auxin-responsive promoter family protein [Nitrospirales bacterium]